jgi:two-component system, LytTR family, response regulator
MQSKVLKAIVVDDEKPSREALTTYIRDFCPGVEIVAECDSVKPAYQAILKYQPQLVFLDIEMPNGNGFDLLRTFKTPSFKVIFVTAYSEYALRAFRFAAADYLLKPVKVDELVEAVNKVKHDIDNEYTNLNLQILMEDLAHQNNHLYQLVVPDNKGFTVVKIADLIMCEADGYCTHLYLTGKRKICSTKSMKHFEDIFANQQIIRVHRSFLVNLSKITGYTKQGEIRLEENLCCPLGNNYRQQFGEVLGKKV